MARSQLKLGLSNYPSSTLLHLRLVKSFRLRASTRNYGCCVLSTAPLKIPPETSEYDLIVSSTISWKTVLFSFWFTKRHYVNIVFSLWCKQILCLIECFEIYKKVRQVACWTHDRNNMLTKNKLTAYSVPGGAKHFTYFISFNLHNNSRFYYFIMGKLEFSKMKKIIHSYTTIKLME